MKNVLAIITTCTVAPLLFGCDGGTCVKVDTPVAERDPEHRDDAGRPHLPRVSVDTTRGSVEVDIDGHSPGVNRSSGHGDAVDVDVTPGGGVKVNVDAEAIRERIEERRDDRRHDRLGEGTAEKGDE
jgi:hypothetical protein